MSDIKLVGLDLETSGSDWHIHQPIEVGIVIENPAGPELYEARIRPNYANAEWDEEAEGVHQISKAELKDEPRIEVVDGSVAYWLHRQLTGVDRINRWPVGWNVRGFDMAMIENWMPLTYRELSYRSLDLNTATHVAADALTRDFAKYKADLKGRAEAELKALGVEVKWHNALFDARAGLIAYDLMIGDLNNYIADRS